MQNCKLITTHYSPTFDFCLLTLPLQGEGFVEGNRILRLIHQNEVPDKFLYTINF